MAQLVIEVPNVHARQIAEAIAATYGVEPTAAGVRKHLIQHLRRTVLDRLRQQAVEEREKWEIDQATTVLVFGPDWDDLEEEE